MLTEVQYRYGADENGTVVDIDSEDIIRSKDYTCLSCNNYLRPVLGQIRQHHFRHRILINCSIETYLHNLAKRMFYQTYNDCLSLGVPYELEYKVQKQCTFCKHGPCFVGTISKKTDLTHYFKEIFLETRDGEFTPDILLKNEKDSFYVEIAVSHYLEEPKSNSGVRIIEISINDENDVDLVRTCFLSENDGRVSTYNLRPAPVSGNFKKECKKQISSFVLYPSGKSFIDSIAIWKYEKLISEGTYTELVKSLSAESYIDKVTEAFKLGENIKNCWLCTFHCLSYRTKESFCKIFKRDIERGKSNQAVECAKYRPKASIPACGLMQDAVNQVTQGSNKAINHHKLASNDVLPVPIAGYGPEPVSVFFHGISMVCTGCNSPLHLITFVQFERFAKVLNIYRVMGTTAIYYQWSALSRVLATIQDGTSIQEIGTLVKTKGKLAVQCGKCSEVNLPGENAKDEKQVYHGRINPSEYRVLLREVINLT